MKARIFWSGVSLAALGALVLRSVHLGWGLPEVFEEATPVREAVAFWGTAGRGIDLNPHFFKYPTLTFYLNFLLQAVWYLWLSVIGAVGSLNEYREVLAQDPARVVLAGRWLQAVAGALIVFPAAALGRRLAGSAAGWVAAVLVAVLPLAVRESQLVTPDMFLTLFCALGLAAATRAVEEGRRSDFLWTGVWMGMATAAKYPGAFLIVPLVTAQAVRAVRERRGPAGILLSGTLWQSVFVAVLVFFAASPYVVLDGGAALRDIVFERWHMAVGHLGREEGRALWFYLRRAVPRGGTVPVAGAALVGMLWLAARRRSRSRALPGIAFALVFLGVLGSWTMAAPRYLLPLAAPAVAWAGAGVAAVARLVPLRWRTVAMALVAVAVAAVPLARSLDEVALRGREDSRTAAQEWIASHVPQGSTLLVERYGPRPDPERYNVLYLPFHGVRPHLYDAAYLAPLYATFDYVVLSSQVDSRYLADPGEYPAQAAFYRALERAFREVAVFRAGDFLGPTIRILKRRPDARLRDLSHIPPDFYEGFRGNRPMAEYFSALGTVLVRQGRGDLGFPLLRRAVDLDPTDAKLWGNLGAMHLEQGNHQEALSALREAQKRAPEDAEIAYDLGTLYQRMREPSEAADAFRRALQLDPAMEEAYLGLARVLVEDERYPEARLVLREFLVRFPRSKRGDAARKALAELRRMGPGRP